MWTRPSASTSTTVAFIGSTKSRMKSDAGSGRRAHGVVYPEHDRREGAVGVIEVDLGVRDRLKRCEARRAVDDEDLTLGDVVAPLPQHGCSVNVVVDDEPQLSAVVEGHREHVDVLVGKHAAHAGERAGVVGQPQRKLGPNHYPSTRITTRRFWARPPLVFLSTTGFVSP